MSREAMQRALDVLEDYSSQHGEPEDICEAINALRAALAEAEAPAPYAYLVVQASGFIVGAWRDRETAEAIAAKQLARDNETVVPVVLAEAPKAEPVAPKPIDLDDRGPVFTVGHTASQPGESAELSDDEILALWQPPLEGNVQRPILGKNKILAFARAVLAQGRK